GVNGMANTDSRYPSVGPPFMLIVGIYSVMCFVSIVLYASYSVVVRGNWDPVEGGPSMALEAEILLAMAVTTVATTATSLALLRFRGWLLLAPWRPVIIGAGLAGIGSAVLMLWLPLPGHGLLLILRFLIVPSILTAAIFLGIRRFVDTLSGRAGR